MESRGRIVVIADDNPDAAESLALLLSREGHDVHTASNGLEAVETAVRVKPDVVLLDIGMPELDGHQAARRIRELPWDKPMMIVALTGWDSDVEVLRSAEGAFDARFTKPVDFAALRWLLGQGHGAPWTKV